MLIPLQPFAVILPTRELVDEYTSFDSHFFFYRGGVKGVIRDAFAMSNGLVKPETDYVEGVLGSVISEFDSFEMNCIDAGIPLKEDNDFETMEMVVDEIQCAVHSFLHQFFVGKQYQIIRPVSFVDRDLIVHAKVF